MENNYFLGTRELLQSFQKESSGALEEIRMGREERTMQQGRLRSSVLAC